MNGFFCKTKYGGVCQMMEDEALQVIQKMNVKINGTEDEVKKVYGALEVAKRALKKGIEAHHLEPCMM
ncbi:hypothetical protein DW993_16660 [Clostridium sp. AM51-4]|nr:hypothetical protein DW993_16660 [Clostridium sp. AM51-4]RHQ12309.1 hypothetical protein DW974_18720 [Lachnospiraceae bacterium AM48-27BH]